MQDQPIRLIRLKEVMAMTGLSHSHVYQLIEEGYFPQSISLGARAVAGSKEKCSSGLIVE